MKLERVELYFISMPLARPFATSFGTQSERECLLVAMHSEGLTGWGECVATNDPGYSYETATTAWHILKDFLAPTLVGRSLLGPEEVAQRLSFVRGHPLAKAALEQAHWDLDAQRQGVSLAARLAAPYDEPPRQRVAVGVSLGVQPSLEQLLEVIAEHVESGYRRVKLKIKPGFDLEAARSARQAFPDLPLMLDANSAYSLDDAPLFQAMDDLDLLMLEQPLGHDDIYEHSQLRPLISTPLCLDESIGSYGDMRLALALRACDVLNVKPSRVSGWHEARRLHDLCVKSGIPAWVGGMLESGVGRAGQLALAALPGFTLPGDISATERYYAEDIATSFALNREDSTIDVPSRPGLGVEINWQRLKAVTKQYLEIKPH